MRFDAINRLNKLHRELGLPGRVQQTPQGAFILVQPLAGNETEAANALRRLAQPEEQPVPQEEQPYKSQAARDAQASNYGEKSYWDYLDQHAQELHDKFAAKGDHETAAKMLTRTLSESLMGNDGI